MTTPELGYELLSNLRPPERMLIWQWAERHIYLSTRQATGFPGYYRTDITPYVKGIFDALQDPYIHIVSVEKGAQTGLTLVGYIWCCFCISEDPGAMLLVYPNEKLAKSASESRMMPMIEDSPHIRNQITDNPDEFTKLQYRLKQCTVNWIGSNSPANLSSRPARYLMEDETDKYPTDNNTEASPLSLAEQRTKTFWNHKIYRVSTPTIPEGVIHQSFLEGDQRRYFIPCHKCGGMQFMKWPQVKWPEAEPVKAQYQCEFCGSMWSDVQKTAAVRNGEWRPTAEAKRKGHASFHLSSLYSQWTRLGELAITFLAKKANPHEFQDFINSELGEPFQHFDDSIKDEMFIPLEGDYEEGKKWTQAPAYKEIYGDTPSVIIAGVDVQKGYLVAVFREFIAGGDSGLIIAQDVSGFQELETMAAELNAEYIIVDNRYRTHEVNEWSYAHKGYIPCQGVERKSRVMCTVSDVDIDEGRRGHNQGRIVAMLSHNPNMVKDLLSIQVHKYKAAKRWMIPRGYSARTDYTAQMTAERSVNGKWVAVPAGKPNHFWDAERLAMLGAMFFGWFTTIGEETKKGGDDGQSIPGDSDA